MKKILMIAFHYPPFSGGSGIHRTLKFSRYLPENGWQPFLLTPRPKAYEEVREDRIKEIPPGITVTRAFALDAKKHLSFRGSYFRFSALPDRWASWWFGAVPAGLRVIRKHRPDLIWSTYPVATAHLIGLTLHRISGIPWIADFRDPMTEEIYPYDPVTWKVYRKIEEKTVAHCARAVFTTEGTRKMYAERYPGIPRERWKVIANGFDEEDFAFTATESFVPRTGTNRVTLVHSGVLYTLERDPRAFFAALGELKRKGDLSASTVNIVLRGSGNEESLSLQLKENGVEDIVSLEKPIPYGEALRETVRADGLLLFQAANTNHSIPAKMYEYLRAGRPVFAMTDPRGDTGRALTSAGIDTVVPLESKEAIVAGFSDFLARLRKGNAPVARAEVVEACSRRYRTKELSELLNSVG